MGHACVHLVIDGYSRVVYSEIHDDEKADTTVGVLQRAVSWFSTRGVRVERVLSDNGAAYRSDAWQAACQQLSVKAKRTHPYRPQINSKIERFHRTLADGWAYARHYDSETQRCQALPAWLYLYNHHRPHTARYLVGGPGWSGAGPAAVGTGVLPLSSNDPGGESHPRQPGAGDR